MCDKVVCERWRRRRRRRRRKRRGGGADGIQNQKQEHTKTWGKKSNNNCQSAWLI